MSQVGKHGDLRLRFHGCLLGGAIGDALGAPVEFDSMPEIEARFGAGGIRDYVPAYGRLGAITDDTQMTLFTAEGLLRSYVRYALRGFVNPTTVVCRAYLRWLETQGYPSKAEVDREGLLWSTPELHSQRAPGTTCLAALEARSHVSANPAQNDSKGCGGVMRVAPVGLMCVRDNDGGNRAFDLAVKCAALTHGHPTGSLTAGVMAVLVACLVSGASSEAAIAAARSLLVARAGHEETLAALDAAVQLASRGAGTRDSIEQLGAGWVAEEALAIGLYCSLVATSFENGVILAVNHGGDSDSTGSIAGQLLGARLGLSAIPARWLESLELKELITSIADDLYECHAWPIGDYSEPSGYEHIWNRWPGT